MLSDVRPKILEYLLQFMYCGSVEVPAGDLNDFLSSGKNLHIKGLQAINSEHLSSVSKDNKIISNEVRCNYLLVILMYKICTYKH